MSSWCKNCEDWIFKCSCREREKISSLESELASVKDQLREAVEVIRFYGDRANWRYSGYSGDDRFYTTITFFDSSYVIKEKQRDNIGGKRARAFLAKYQLNSEEGR